MKILISVGDGMGIGNYIQLSPAIRALRSLHPSIHIFTHGHPVTSLMLRDLGVTHLERLTDAMHFDLTFVTFWESIRFPARLTCCSGSAANCMPCPTRTTVHEADRWDTCRDWQCLTGLRPARVLRSVLNSLAARDKTALPEP